MSERTYYVGEGQEAKAVIDAAFSKVQAFRDAAQTLLDGMPEGAMLLFNNGGNGTVLGFCIPGELTDDEMSGCGIKTHDLYSDGNGPTGPQP